MEDRDFNLKSLFLFVLPAIITYLFNGFYSMVDGAFIEKFVGPYAVAAISLYYPVLNLVLGLGLMIGAGGSVALAALQGEGDQKTADKLFTQLVMVALSLGVLIAVFGDLFPTGIAHLLGATDGNIAYFMDYYRIMISTTPVLIFAAIVMPFCLAEGKVVAISVASVLGGITNIVLDYVFMGVLGMGIEGAAAATMIGYAIPVAYALFFYLNLNGKGSSFRFRVAKPMVKRVVLSMYNGSSEMVSNLANGVTALIMNHLAYRFYREAGVSVVSVFLYIQFMIMAVFMGMTSTVEPLISYHYGAKDYERGRKIYSLSMQLTVIFTVVLTVVMGLFYRNFVGIFFENAGEQQIFYEIGCVSLKFAIPACLLTGFNILICGLFTAYGNGTVSAILSILRTLVFLVAAMYTLPLLLPNDGLWLSWFGAELPALIVSVILLSHYKERYYLKRT
ncbi:MAG: hypothetical protein J5518_11300 [Lachnospiraceae bacterium]|nr:hypothetical protein [Lachnospiraceae bacterium]